MPNPHRRASPGAPLRIPAAAYNKMLEAAAAAERNRTVNSSGDRRELPPPTVLVKNSTAEALNRFDVLAIAGPIIEPADNEAEFSDRVRLIGAAPTAADAGKFVVLAEPLGPGKIGRAYATGICPAWIKGEGTHVDVEDATTSYLFASGSGTARILWSEAGDGERWALIRFADSKASVRWGKADTDWTAFSELSVTVWTGTPAAGEATETTVDCVAPGTDGEGMEGIVGLILPVEGYGPELLHQFVPLQCEPTPVGSGDE